MRRNIRLSSLRRRCQRHAPPSAVDIKLHALDLSSNEGLEPEQKNKRELLIGLPEKFCKFLITLLRSFKKRKIKSRHTSNINMNTIIISL